MAKRFNTEIIFLLHVVPSYGLSTRLRFTKTILNGTADIMRVSEKQAAENRLNAFLQTLPLGNVRHRHRIVKGSIYRQIIQRWIPSAPT